MAVIKMFVVTYWKWWVTECTEGERMNNSGWVRGVPCEHQRELDVHECKWECVCLCDGCAGKVMRQFPLPSKFTSKRVLKNGQKSTKVSYAILSTSVSVPPPCCPTTSTPPPLHPHTHTSIPPPHTHFHPTPTPHTHKHPPPHQDCPKLSNDFPKFMLVSELVNPLVQLRWNMACPLDLIWCLGWIDLIWWMHQQLSGRPMDQSDQNSHQIKSTGRPLNWSIHSSSQIHRPPVSNQIRRSCLVLSQLNQWIKCKKEKVRQTDKQVTRELTCVIVPFSLITVSSILPQTFHHYHCPGQLVQFVLTSLLWHHKFSAKSTDSAMRFGHLRQKDQTVVQHRVVWRRTWFSQFYVHGQRVQVSPRHYKVSSCGFERYSQNQRGRRRRGHSLCCALFVVWTGQPRQLCWLRSKISP